MPPPLSRLDPEGYYARLGVEQDATQASIVAAFRAKARLLHPDVPGTGDTAGFVAVKEAYDVLSRIDRRAAYDRRAKVIDLAEDDRDADLEEIVVDVRVYRRPAPPPPPPVHRRRSPGLAIKVWAGLGAFLCLCLYEATVHIMAHPPFNNAGIRPNAASVDPLSPSADRAVRYGSRPAKLAGTPNFYVVPAGTPAVLWRLDAARDALVPMAKLPPFTAVQAIRLVRAMGMLEVLVNDSGNGFISTDHLAPGGAAVAMAAYCGYNAGPIPDDGELLEHHGTGDAALSIENRAVQPAVVKLRDETGAVAASVFLAPGGHATVRGLPAGVYRPEFAIGELWSRACNSFAAGMLARRMDAPITLPEESRIVLSPDEGEPAATEIPDQAFERE